jgi:phosphatidylserine decarboxylase
MNRLISSLTQQEQLNFLLTNRIPRRALTRFIGWYSRLRNPLLAKLSIALWKLFADLDLSEAKQQSFASLHDCFIRELKPGARSIDPRSDIITSPCDAIVGACGRVETQTVYQAKGYPYQISDLIPDPAMWEKFRNGVFVTLRLKSSMYHRFHAPSDCRVSKVTYISGDTWNVNPIALKRIEKLYCKNERAVIELHDTPHQQPLALVPVAAILVASMKFHCLDDTLDLQYRGPNEIPCNAEYKKGGEMGYFQHGSTIIMFASSAYHLSDGIGENTPIKMGQALLQISV